LEEELLVDVKGCRCTLVHRLDLPQQMCTCVSECKCNYVSMCVYLGERCVVYPYDICWAEGDACNGGESSDSTKVYDELEMSIAVCSLPWDA